VVVHDGLVDPAILLLAPPSARLISVAKSRARHTMPQEEINALLVRLAKAGRRVVRLKSGDPLVFGRAGEEMAALREAGIAYDPDLVITGALIDPVHEYDYLWDALDRLLRASPTAICCANDKMAMRVCALLRQRGLRVGEDISVAGYDDYRIITEHMDPPLTSIELPYAAMGMRAAEKLLRLINGTSKPNESARELVSGPVVWRNSVKTIQQVVTPFKTRRNDLS